MARNMLKFAKTPGRDRKYRVPKAQKWMVQALSNLMLGGEIYSFWVPAKDHWYVRMEESDDWGEPYTAEEMSDWLTND